MNFGSIGSLVLSQSGVFEFAYEKEIFSAFGLSDKSKLHGIYYPCPEDKEDEAYREATLKHDFLITPIPPVLWKASARVHIFLKNSPGTLKALCNYLKENKISIIHSESSRSSYRYATWSLHIVFEDLLHVPPLKYNELGSYYEETQDKLDNFVKQCLIDMKDYLCKPHHLKVAIKGHPNFNLAYFANYQIANPSNTFTLKVVDPDKAHRRQRLIGDADFARLMNKIVKDTNSFTGLPLLPATTFSEIDTNDLNLRTVLISQHDAKRFTKVKLKYIGTDKSDSPKDTHVGIMSDITAKMPEYFNIWHSYDRTIDNKPAEEGEIIFLIENVSHFMVESLRKMKKGSDQVKNDSRDEDSYRLEVENTFKDILSKSRENKDYYLSELVVFRLPSSGVINQQFLLDGRIDDFEYDVFISYSQKDKERDEKDGIGHIKKLLDLFYDKRISYFLDSRVIKSGDGLDKSILDGIKKSREMCIVTSTNSLTSEWMTIERGAASVLGKTITPYIIHGEKEKLSKDLKMTIDVDATDDFAVKKFADDIIERRDKYLANKFRTTFVR